MEFIDLSPEAQNAIAEKNEPLSREAQEEIYLWGQGGEGSPHTEDRTRIEVEIGRTASILGINLQIKNDEFFLNRDFAYFTIGENFLFVTFGDGRTSGFQSTREGIRLALEALLER